MPSALEARAARLFCVGFRGLAPSPELAELTRRGVRSVVLFARNVGEPRDVAELTRAIKRLAPEPIAIAVDQEGGNVRRLRRGFTQIPCMRAVGRTGDAELATATGRLLGAELRAVGIDVAFAPVLDVDTNPNNPVIGARSFGSDPELVARLGIALAAGIQSAGVAACGKHFPGHGDTDLDSHLALPRLAHPRERVDAVELVPFRRAAEAGIASMMTAHVVFSALDAGLPATLSRTVMSILREDIGYDGLVISDDLEMRAIVDHFGLEEAVLLGLEASIDLFLVCHTPERMHRAIDAVIHGVESGRIAADRLDRAVARVDRFLARWAAPADAPRALEILRSAEHRALEARLAALPGAAAEERDPTTALA
ncbi:MAG: beta-N-acetylhexosaminidase [Pseudomonadota bacterium]|nr:MAG: beta-N-acetylhexosaminidase [Pseudomonadota bacterium]